MENKEIPKEINDQIKGAWMAGCFSIGITLLFIGLSYVVEEIAAMGIGAEALIDVTIMALLTYGIFKKSRACAVGMFCFFLLNKIIMWGQAGGVSGLPMAILFLYFYGRGVQGTYAHHKLMQDRTASHDSTPGSESWKEV